jgi:hypothetical protein
MKKVLATKINEGTPRREDEQRKKDRQVKDQSTSSIRCLPHSPNTPVVVPKRVEVCNENTRIR